MNGNNINDVYVDEEDRIWLANYPTGITIRNNVMEVILIRHSLGNTRSLVNDQVHDVVEDSDGASGLQPVTVSVSIRLIQKNGVPSLVPLIRYRIDENHIFLALCEVSPGVMWLVVIHRVFTR